MNHDDLWHKLVLLGKLCGYPNPTLTYDSNKIIAQIGSTTTEIKAPEIQPVSYVDTMRDQLYHKIFELVGDKLKYNVDYAIREQESSIDYLKSAQIRLDHANDYYNKTRKSYQEYLEQEKGTVK